MEVIRKENLSLVVSNITRENIRDIALEFSTSQVNPLIRAKITYILKKLVEDISKFDKFQQETALEEFYENNKSSSTMPMLDESFGIVKKANYEKKYSEPELAEQIQNQIKELQEQLKALEIGEIKGYSYFIKERSLK